MSHAKPKQLEYTLTLPSIGDSVNLAALIQSLHDEVSSEQLK